MLDFPLFADNPLLSPFICESCRVYWLHRTGFLISTQRHLYLIIVFPFSTLHVALFSPSLFCHVMLNAPPSIHPPRALRCLIWHFWLRNRGNVTPFVFLSYLVHIIVLYLYSVSILYYQHFLLTRHLPKITKISILSSLTTKYPLHFYLLYLDRLSHGS